MNEMSPKKMIDHRKEITKIFERLEDGTILDAPKLCVGDSGTGLLHYPNVK